MRRMRRIRDMWRRDKEKEEERKKKGRRVEGRDPWKYYEFRPKKMRETERKK